ncbi:hypothetical protein B566_EDAN008587 [Ephemera danica]|nr:hypothetical protein B566_EDAN008587 [Ephemera danica]
MLKRVPCAFQMSRLDCGNVVAKYCLTVFNLLFFIAGSILLGLGIWLAADKNSFIRFVTKISEDETLHQFSQPTVIEQAAWILIGAGAFIFVISCLGYCGAAQESYCMLGTADVSTRQFLKTSIRNYYAGPDKKDAVTLMWDYLMAQFSCCGVDDYNDFRLSEKWASQAQAMPTACCVLVGDIKHFRPLDPGCPNRPSASNSYYDQGCYKALLAWIQTHLNVVIAVCVTLAAVQVLGIIFACCLCHAIIRE